VGITDKEVAVPSFKRRASVTDTDRVEATPKAEDGTADDALTLAEQAEAEAAEAEAVAAAARAKAKAIRLRREAQESEAKAKAEAEAKAAAEADTEDDAEVTADAPVDIDAFEAERLDAEGEDVQDAAPRRRRWGLILKVVAMTLAIMCTAALITLSVLMVNEHRKAVKEQQLNAEYSAAGRQSVVTLMSLDFNTADEAVKRIIENTTGQFKTDFEDQAADFVKVAQDSKVITDVTVTSTAVESMTPDSAVVLVAATSRVTNASGAKQEPRAWRLSVNLERVDGGQIKMSKVEFVP
jgi:Mce-associated membrane protein